LLGSDSYAAAEKSALDKIESDRNWKDLSLTSQDYSSDETPVLEFGEFMKDDGVKGVMTRRIE
jgi:hypothetical protein